LRDRQALGLTVVARERYDAATLHNSVRRCWFVRRHPATLPLPIGVFVEVGTASILRVAIATTSPLLSSSASLLAQTELATGGVVDSWSSRRRARSRLRAFRAKLVGDHCLDSVCRRRSRSGCAWARDLAHPAERNRPAADLHSRI
jgi:hypothetical protein